MSKPRKYHTSATDGGKTLPHYLSRCPASHTTNSPKQTGREFVLCPNKPDGAVCGTANTMLAVYIQCQSVSSTANLSLSCQTC